MNRFYCVCAFLLNFYVVQTNKAPGIMDTHDYMDQFFNRNSLLCVLNELNSSIEPAKRLHKSIKFQIKKMFYLW